MASWALADLSREQLTAKDSEHEVEHRLARQEYKAEPEQLSAIRKPSPAFAPPTIASVEVAAKSDRQTDIPKVRALKRRKVAMKPEAPNGEALANMGDDYGLTWPQDMEVEMLATKLGNDWAPKVSRLTGTYSRQTQLVDGPGGVKQIDITSAALATLANYQLMLQSLDQLGTPGDTFTHYSLAAVQAHEDQHANRVRLALENLDADISKRFAAITVPILTPTETAAAAEIRIRADPRWAPAVTQSVQDWNTEFDRLIADDHAGDGACEVAERRVTQPLAKAIRARAVTEKWLATPGQIGGGLGAGQFNALKTGATTSTSTVSKTMGQGPTGGLAAIRSQLAKSGMTDK